MKMEALTYAERSKLCSNPVGKKLFLLMEEKKSNLAVAADFTRGDELLDFARSVGSEISVLKTHIDILEDFSPEITQQLQKIANESRFLLFEDRKFADIGSTVQLQYRHGIYHISAWADIVNAHIIPGPGIISGLKEVGLPLGRGLLLLAEMSSKGSLADSAYAQKAIRMAEENDEFVIGFISMRRLSDNPRWIYMTPGIQLTSGGDPHGQQYQTPASAIAAGTDVIIVGRGIYSSQDPQKQAALYRDAGWKAYERRSQ